jgi:hypothetical protein
MDDMNIAYKLIIGDYVVFSSERRLYCRGDRSSITAERGDKAEVINIGNTHVIDIRFSDGRIAYGCSTDCMEALIAPVSSKPDTRVWATRQQRQ